MPRLPGCPRALFAALLMCWAAGLARADQQPTSAPPGPAPRKPASPGPVGAKDQPADNFEYEN